VTGVAEFGMLQAPLQPAYDRRSGAAEVMANMRFSTAVDYQLARSAGKDIVLFVDDPQVRFDHTLTRSAQLWYYLGYDGALVVYSGPDSPPKAAFVRRLKAFALGSGHLRNLLLLLAEESDARNVHIIGCGKGSLIVYQALKELSLMAGRRPEKGGLPAFKLGQVIIIGDQVDLELFDVFNRDRLVETVERVSFYLPLTGRPADKGGGTRGTEKPLVMAERMLEQVETGRISLIAEPPVEWTGTANGDGFFGSNPWLSSDVLICLKLGLGPGERGLVRDSFTAPWIFPIDYIERVQKAASEYYR
jgi:hypothetical protein